MRCPGRHASCWKTVFNSSAHFLLLILISKTSLGKREKETGRKEDCSSKQQADKKFKVYFFRISKFVAVATVEAEAETEAAETDHAIIMEFVLFSPSGEG